LSHCPITSGTIANLNFPGTPFATNLVGTIAAIPEPASLALFCIGLAGIGGVRRGKREVLSAT
jgi:PEP-CTERM motif-containing protein